MTDNVTFLIPQTRLTDKQQAYLLNPLRSTRVATRSQGGKTLSYLESWDVRAHLNRIFGFANWDLEMVDHGLVAVREYQSGSGTDMVEPIWRAQMTLTIRSVDGATLARYTEAAVGSASAPANMLSEAHDNALKTAASDALKRCAINLGTQFGLSLYDNGSKADVVKVTLAWEPPAQPVDTEKAKTLEASVGVTPTGEQTSEGATA